MYFSSSKTAIFSVGFLDRVRHQFSSRVGQVVDLVLVLEEVGADDSVVNEHRAIAVQRDKAPDLEDALNQPVHREPANQEVGEVFHDGEYSVHHPIS